MRLVKIQLKRSVPFWSLSGLVLNSSNNISNPIDVDSLSEYNINTINIAVKRGEINIFDMSGKIIRSICDTIDLNEVYVSDKDVEYNYIPEVESVTVSLEDEEDEVPITKSPEDQIEEALIIINNNGNTVKRSIAALDTSDSNTISFLNACLSVEIGGKNRVGVIDCIQAKLGEC